MVTYGRLQEASRLERGSRIRCSFENCHQKTPKPRTIPSPDQWRRAAYSVPLNIAEGTGRKGPREFCRYLSIALGSLHELEAILELIESLEYIPDQIAEVKAKRADCARMVYGLIQRFS